MEKEQKTKVVFTGGHAATTAIAVVEEIIRRGKGWDVYWIGAETALEGKKVPTLESEAFPKLGVTHKSIKAGKLQVRFTFWTIPSLFKIPIGFFQAFGLLRKIKPEIILSFGGYAAFPVVVSGYLLGVPVILHEQTIVAGRANRFSSFFAKKIALARAQSQKFFPKSKCVLTGNPVLTQIGEVLPKKEKGNPFTIFITGGSRGSMAINNVVEVALRKLLLSNYLVHQTGLLDYPKFLRIKAALPKTLTANYEVYPRIDPMEIDNVYRQADMVIARAGANTVSEIIATARPSILIPIPWTYLDEQIKNAKYAKDLGIATVIEEKDFSDKTLLESIAKVSKDWNKMVSSIDKKNNPDILASQKLVDILEETLG